MTNLYTKMERRSARPYTSHPTKTYRQLRRTIGRNIHILRTEQSMRLQKLSNLTGLPVWLLDEYELGKGNIELFYLLRIAFALNVNVIDLIF